MLAEAVALAIPVEMGLRWLPPKKLIAHLGRSRPTGARRRTAIDADRAARIVDVVSAFDPIRSTCLKSSLILFRILRKRGVPATLRIGVRRDEKFTAHAWIEFEGRVLLGGGVDHLYTPLPLNA